MLKKIGKRFSLIMTVVFLALFAWYFINNKDSFSVLLEIKPIYLALVILGNVLVIFTNGLIIKWIMEPYKIKISTSEAFYVSYVSSIGNFFLPVGSGTGLRAVYLKKNHNLNYKRFLSTLYGNYVIVFLINSIAGLLALMALSAFGNTSGRVLALAFLFLIAATTYIAFFNLPKFIGAALTKYFGRYGRVIGEIFNGWDYISANKRLLWRLLFAATMNFCSAIVLGFATFKAVGVDLSFWSLILMASLSVLTLILNITPAGLGIKEGLYIFSAANLGISTAVILAAAIVDRSVKFLVLFIGWAYFKLARRV